jgi:hypothetical protein
VINLIDKLKSIINDIINLYQNKAEDGCSHKDYPINITENQLYKLIEREVKNTNHLKNFLGIEQVMCNIAKAESNFFTYATRYERHLDDMSVGIYQILTSTIKWLGYEGSILEMFGHETQVKYAVKYIDYLYNRFSEIKDTHNRLIFSVMAYNCGIGNVNRLLANLRIQEGIRYDGENTQQGNWSNYNFAITQLHKITGTNAEITKRYIARIF